ncbi:MAG: SGNH/GDSL hydrolase family protein [Kiritimatiellia bacterium]
MNKLIIVLLLLTASAIYAVDADYVWHDIRGFGVEGRAFNDTELFYDRLPARATNLVRKTVWNLSRDSAGMAVRFFTDATTIKARWELKDSGLAMDHMPATGVSGLDLYVKVDGQWRWLGVGRPKKFPVNEGTIVSGIAQGKREYLLYLPLYNGVKKVEIGIPPSFMIKNAPVYPESKRKPLLFYGTSITHGACASRPGMTHSAMLGRRFQRPIVNLGFSGQGRMEIEVAHLIAEVDAAVYIIDCLPNIDAKTTAARTEPLVRHLREKRPDTPILFVEDRNYSNSYLIAGKKKRNETSQAALRDAYERLKKDGVKHLYYLEGKGMLGDDFDGTVDSSHPNDLGFWRQANHFEAALRKIPELTR